MPRALVRREGLLEGAALAPARQEALEIVPAMRDVMAVSRRPSQSQRCLAYSAS